MQRALDSMRCRYAAFTADGPRGPAFYAKPGGVKLAQLAGGGVGIFYAAPMHAWKLRSWDRFLIPKPFSTIVIGWHESITVPAQADAETIERVRLAVEDALEQTRRAVEEHIGGKLGYATRQAGR